MGALLSFRRLTDAATDACPVCGELGDPYSIGTTRWLACHRDRVRWPVHPDRRHPETEAASVRNAIRLRGYSVVGKLAT